MLILYSIDGLVSPVSVETPIKKIIVKLVSVKLAEQKNSHTIPAEKQNNSKRIAEQQNSRRTPNRIAETLQQSNSSRRAEM